MSVADLITKASQPRTRKYIPDDKPTPRKWDGQNALPTEAEITEGAAWITLQSAPTDEHAIDTHRDAWNALQKAQSGNTGVRRCLSCGTLVWGRPKAAGCGNCGGKETA